MFKLMGKEINAILVAQTILIWTYGNNIMRISMTKPQELDVMIFYFE